MNRMFRRTAILGLVVAVAGLATTVIATPQTEKKSSDDSAIKVKVGEKVPNFTLTDLDGKKRSLDDYKGKYVVIEWTNPECPYVKGVYSAGIVAETVKKMKEMGGDYVYIAVNSTAKNMSRDDVIEQNKKFLKEHDLDFPVLIDYDGTVGHMFGARHTPDLYVIDKDQTLRYFGGYTDDPGSRKGKDATNYVLNALTQLRSGDSVAPDTARRWGCGVKYADSK